MMSFNRGSNESKYERQNEIRQMDLIGFIGELSADQQWVKLEGFRPHVLHSIREIWPQWPAQIR